MTRPEGDVSQSPFEALPSVEKLSHKLDAEWGGKLPRSVRNEIIRRYLGECRTGFQRGEAIPSEAAIGEEVAARFQSLRQRQFRKCINATGVVLHTNLGRAPLGKAALEKAASELAGYSLLEMEADSPVRGSRTASVEPLLCHLLNAEAAAVVNNNAAAVFLALFALAKGKAAIVSRGELVQIGGGFRVPDILEASGARLVEVGTTNITRLADYEKALSENTGAVVLKVHQSNFSIEGHTESVTVRELATLAKKNRTPLLVDWGSGALDTNVGDEPSMKQLLRDGASVLCFSGDKLLGGPQAGVLVGEKALLMLIKKSPLYRALRLSKFELFLLEEALLQFLEGAPSETTRLLTLTGEALAARATKFLARMKAAGLAGELRSGQSEVGGGTSPQLNLPTTLVEWRPRNPDREAVAKRLFLRTPAVVFRREKNGLSLDLRTVFEEEEEPLLKALLEGNA